MKLNEVNAGYVISFHTAHAQIIVSASFKWFAKENLYLVTGACLVTTVTGSVATRPFIAFRA